MSGLGESVRGEWSGDVDLAYGALNKAHKLYQQRIDFLDQIETGNKNREPLQILADLTAKKQKLIQDVDFVSECEFN